MFLSYLSELEKNNDQAWFHAHKDEYREATSQFLELVQDLIFEIGKWDPSVLPHVPKDLTFKLMRDTRFSHDKSPYNPAFRCHIGPAGKLPIPVGYFLFLMPSGRSFIGGGLFAGMFKDATEKIRRHIATHGEEFKEIIESAAFAEVFQVKGESLKNVPKGYDPAHSMSEYLKFKSWYVEDFFKDEIVNDKSAFIAFASERFFKMKPFNDFLNQALEGFEMPKR